MEEIQMESSHRQQQQDSNGNPVINGGGGGGIEGNNSNNNNSMNNGDGNGVLYVKVMTDEQLEILRTQIAVYATICEQLVEMHKAFTSQQDLVGVRLGGNLYCDPVVIGGHKITARQRWTPTPQQLQILEHIFDQGTGTPTKQKIKEITTELSQHGQISETNVYNWFQNRRARSKRKQQNNANNNAESEVETDAESPNDKKARPESFQSQVHLASRTSVNEDMSHQNHDITSDLQKVEPMFASEGSSKSSESLSQLAMYESILQNPRIDHLIGKMEVPGNYDYMPPPEDYSMTG